MKDEREFLTRKTVSEKLVRDSKRYIVISIILCMVFLFKFHILELDEAEVGVFRGGELKEEVWYPLVANDVNSKELTLMIDNKAYSSKKYDFYMDNNRNIMVPITILRDAMDCSAHLYENKRLLVEKHNLNAVLVLEENEAVSTGERVIISSPLTEIEGVYYVSLNDLSNMMGYHCSFSFEQNMLTTADASENPNALPASYDLRARKRISEIRNQGK